MKGPKFIGTEYKFCLLEALILKHCLYQSLKTNYLTTIQFCTYSMHALSEEIPQNIQYSHTDAHALLTHILIPAASVSSERTKS